MSFSWSGILPSRILTCILIYHVLSSNFSLISFVTTEYNLLVWLIFFITPFNLKTRVAWSRDLTWFDTNINLISIHIDSCFCFKFTHRLLSDTYFQMALFLFCHIISYVVKTNLWYWDLIKTLRPKLEISKFVHFAVSKNYHHHFKVEFSQISSIFLICFGCFLLIQQRKKLVELQKFYTAISLQYWQFQDNRLVTKTCNLWEQDETWNLQDRD